MGGGGKPNAVKEAWLGGKPDGIEAGRKSQRYGSSEEGVSAFATRQTRCLAPDMSRTWQPACTSETSEMGSDRVR